jgi:16S rRNA (guanine966-N2)-methyltransferase
MQSLDGSAWHRSEALSMAIVQRQRAAGGDSPQARGPRKPAVRRAQAHEVRIIGGLWKRTKLPVLSFEGLRPTPDRVRETLFNWLGQDLSGWRVLDAFAGTGALGFEAASRGATHVQLLEREAALIKPMAALKERLKATTVHIGVTEALGWMARAPAQSFDLVFLDPPFGVSAGVGPAVISDLHTQGIARAALLLKPDGYLYVEAPAEMAPPVGLLLRKHLRAGAVHAHLWQKASSLPTSSLEPQGLQP